MDQYGGFAISQSIFLIFAVAHTALFTEPMLVFAHRTFAQRRKAFYLSLLRLQTLFLVVVFAIFCAGGFLLKAAGISGVGESLIGFAVAGPSLLMFSLLRRTCYCENKPSHAAAAALMYSLLSVGSIVILVALSAVTSVGLLLAAAGSAAVSSGYLFLEVKRLPGTSGCDLISRAEIVPLHWRYARWSFAAGLAAWVPANIGSVVLPIWADLNAVGLFRALVNLIQPVYQVSVAIGGLVIPALSRHRESRKFWEHGAKVIAALGAFSVLYAIVLAVWGPLLTTLIYGGRYSGHSFELIILGLSGIFFSIWTGTNAVLRAMARPDWIFYANVIGAAVALSSGILATIKIGLLGTALAMAVGYGIPAVVVISRVALARRHEGRSSQSAPHQGQAV